MLGGFVEGRKWLVADQNHFSFLSEHFFAGIPEQKLSRRIHLSDAQIRGEDDDAFFEVVGDGMLDLDDMADIVESPLGTFEAV